MKLLAPLTVGLLTTSAAYAVPIEDIQVEGNERVEDATVMSYLNVSEGDEFDNVDVSDTIRQLYRTGLFSNVEINWDGSTFKVNVAENPLINKVAFEGNDDVDDDRLNEIIRLKSRVVYTSDKVQNDVQSILAYYRQSGRFLTQVQPQIIERDQNRVDVIYKIEEGEKTKIRSIRFVGNHRFSDSELKTIVRTRESRWWRFLSNSDVYDSNRVEFDKELLRRFYIESGYADFRVVSAVTELSKDKTDFYITYTVAEGEPYDFGTVDVRLEDVQDEEGLSRDDLLKQLSIEEGSSYNGVLVEKEIDTLIDYLGSKGYAFLDVQPLFNKDEAAQTVALTFNVVPGPRVYVNRINFRGNDRTRENVLRREMRFAEGDAFSSNKMKRSKDRLNYLGFFENVDVTTEETDVPDRVDINVDVKEQSTGDLNIGAGFSTYEGPLASASINERNFLGKGQSVRLGFDVSSRRQNFDFSFTEPYFMGRELAAGFDLYNEEIDYQDESSYDLGRTGGGVRLGVPISEYTKDSIRLSFAEVNIDNVQSDASAFVQRDAGKKSSLVLGNTIAKDTRDSYLTPTKGYRVALSTDYSGFGTDISYVKAQANASWHTPISNSKDWILSLGGRIGAINGIGEDLPTYEHFTGGGSFVRGFDYGGIGPRDASTGDSLGGQYMLGNNVELSFPMGTTFKEMGVNGLFFVDGGLVTDFDDSNVSGATIQDTNKYRVSAGTGVYWRSPMGPLRFEFGFPIVKAEEDQSQIFSFSFGTRF